MATGYGFHKTRIAPTPSGFLHLGNLFSFALTAALAKKSGAEILLRIDDLDTDRVNSKYTNDIFETLDFMQIPWQHGPVNPEAYEKNYRQQKHLGFYTKALNHLKDHDLVYACSCSRTQILAADKTGIYPGTCRHKGLALDAEQVCWRLRTDRVTSLSVKIYGRGIIETELPPGIKDTVIRRKDGLPAYQLASVVDDERSGTDLVVRGNDLWPSTVLQVYLSDLLGYGAFKQASFFHHALLRDEMGQKLSKTAGSRSIKYMRENGLTAEKVYGKLAEAAGLKNTLKRWEDLLDQVDDSWNTVGG